MLKSVLGTWGLNGLQMAALLVLSPWVLERLGADPNGLWTALISITGILSLFILGVPMASVRAIAEGVARKDPAAVQRAVSTCMAICAALGLVALLVAGLAYLYFDARILRGTAGAGLDPQTLDSARIAFGILALQVACGFVMRLPYGILEAHSDFLARNAISAFEVLLRFGTTLALLHWRAELAVLALVQVICMLAEFTLALIVLRRRHPSVHFSLRGYDPSAVRGILAFSIFAMLLNVGALLAFRLDGLVISSFLPARAATEFDIGNKFFDPLMQLLISVGAVVMPMATRLKTSGETQALRAIFLRWSKLSLSLVLLTGGYLMVLGPEFLAWWVGEEYRKPSGDVLRVLMLSFFFYLPVRGVALPILMGLGKPRAPALCLLVMGVANLGISLALVGPQGIFGVAIGTALPNLAFAVIVLYLACKELEVGIGEWLVQSALKPLLGACLPVLALILAAQLSGWGGFGALVAFGVGYVALFALIWFAWVVRGDPDLDLLSRWKRRAA
jgi:O-antigen/teichoic acid export membrane protein